MPTLSAPKEEVLPLLYSTERRLLKSPEKVLSYTTEIQRLQREGFVVKLEPGADNTPASLYIPHHMVQHNGKNRVVFNCSFQFHVPSGQTTKRRPATPPIPLVRL